MTTLMRWSPFFSNSRDVASLRDDVDQLFDSLISRSLPSQARAAGFVPAAELQESAEEFVARLDLPGISQKDVKVTLMGDTLTIRGERKLETKREGDGLYYSERVSGAFERTFHLTAPVRGDQVKATYRDGVLEVHVPKAEEARSREIEIRVG